MTTINSALYIGRDALIAHQAGINVAGHNIANVNTHGYSRQNVKLENTAIATLRGSIGTGVRVREIERSHDRFLNNRINYEIHHKNRWQAQSHALRQTEILFDESSSYGLSSQMNQFWTSWQDLSLNPSGYAERKTLITQSQIMTASIRDKYRNLTQIQKDMDKNLVASVEDINSLAVRIADLNDKIALIEIGGSNSNDFRDQRDALVSQLAQKIDFTASDDSEGRLIIKLGDGNTLVGSPIWGKLITTQNSLGFHDLAWDSDPLSPINSSVSGGSIKGWIDVRDLHVPDYKEHIDKLAVNMMNAVNAVHSAGFGLDGSTENVFFTGTSAIDIAVNPEIVENVSKIAAADQDLPELIRGNNLLAIDISMLQNKLTMDGNAASFSTYYHALVSGVGEDVKNAEVNFEHKTTVVDQLNNLQESVSGVSLDEEMISLIKFQHGYSASAKLIDTVKQMMDTVINMV